MGGSQSVSTRPYENDDQVVRYEPSWGPEHLRGRVWLVRMLTRGFSWSSHFSVIIDFAGTSRYENDSTDNIPSEMRGVMFETRLRTTGNAGRTQFLRRAFESVSADLETQPIMPGSYGHIANYLGTLSNLGGHTSPHDWLLSFQAHVLQRTHINGKADSEDRHLRPTMWAEFLCEKRHIAMPWNAIAPTSLSQTASNVLGPWKQGQYVFPATGSAEDAYLAELECWDAVVNCQTWAEFFIQKIGLHLPPTVSTCANSLFPSFASLGFWAVWNFDLKKQYF